jgi:hypothetical protein
MSAGWFSRGTVESELKEQTAGRGNLDHIAVAQQSWIWIGLPLWWVPFAPQILQQNPRGLRVMRAYDENDGQQ